MKKAARFRWRKAGSDWLIASKALSSIAGCLSRRSVSQNALIQGLKDSGSENLRNLAKGVSLPLEGQTISREVLCSESCKGSQWQSSVVDSVSQVLQGSVKTLLSRQHSSTDFHFWRRAFSDLYQVERWMRQHSAQSRVQALFLTGFVPVVSMLFCFFSHERFLSNLSLSQGRITLVVSVLLYLLGAGCVFALVGGSKAYVRNHRGTDDAGGRLNFLQSLIASAGSLPTKRQRLIFAAQNLGCVRAEEFARRLSCAFALPKADHDSSAGIGLQYLESTRFALLESPQPSERWLWLEHSAAFEDLRAESAQKAAVLSLRLLFPMATFFLPALFLILALCGFSMGGDTLN